MRLLATPGCQCLYLIPVCWLTAVRDLAHGCCVICLLRGQVDSHGRRGHTGERLGSAVLWERAEDLCSPNLTCWGRLVRKSGVQLQEVAFRPTCDFNFTQLCSFSFYSRCLIACLALWGCCPPTLLPLSPLHQSFFQYAYLHLSHTPSIALFG